MRSGRLTLLSSLLFLAARPSRPRRKSTSSRSAKAPSRVTEPPCYSGWPPVNVLDDAPASGWASEEARLTNNVFVFELAGTATLTAFEFDTAGIDGDGRGAKDVTVEVSSAANAGFQKVLQADPAGPEERPALPRLGEGRGALRAPDDRQQPRRRRVHGADGLPRLRRAAAGDDRAQPLRHLRHRLPRVPSPPAGHGAHRLLRVQTRASSTARSRAGSRS